MLLAAPSMPEEIREEVEARASAGEKISVAEVQALKRAAARAKDEAERLKLECEDWIKTARSAAEREREVREHLRLARKDAYARMGVVRALPHVRAYKGGRGTGLRG